MTGEELRKTLGWWLVLSFFAVVVGFTYLRTIDTSPSGAISLQNNASYDYVIVGGGAAGSVLASRLSEDPRVTVLLLEAGGEEISNLWNNVPLWSPLGPGTDSDWGYYSVPQKLSCLAAKNQKCFLPMVKLLGGSSMTNRMLYSRGSRHDFTTWAKDKENTWDFKNILPYFLKLEDMLIEEQKISDFHSSAGPIAVTGIPAELSELHELFLSAGQELRYKPIDCSGKDNIGFCRFQATVREGQRSSSVREYLRPAMGRPNLHISTHSIAIKVLIAKKKALGVDYIRNGKKRTVGAKKEIILSAGPIGTPHLLMLSGVGPREHLEKLKIPVHANLAVGSNLQDHMSFKLKVHTNESETITRDRAFNLLSYMQYFVFGRGILASNKGIFGTALIKTDPRSPKNSPDIQLTLSAMLDDLSVQTPLQKAQQENQETSNTTVPASDGFTITVELLHPESRGTVRLQNNNPFTPPIIDPNYLSSQKDIQSLVKGIKLGLSLLTTQSFKSLRAKMVDKPFSSCKQHRIKSDIYWECLIRHLAVSAGQATSTCPMGAISNQNTVVDSNLRVKGIQGLRVADASVIPSSVSGDIFATTIMVAEKAADLVRGHESVKWFRPISERALKL